jgi:hypothetical protein
MRFSGQLSLTPASFIHTGMEGVGGPDAAVFDVSDFPALSSGRAPDSQSGLDDVFKRPEAKQGFAGRGAGAFGMPPAQGSQAAVRISLCFCF